MSEHRPPRIPLTACTVTFKLRETTNEEREIWFFSPTSQHGHGYRGGWLEMLPFRPCGKSYWTVPVRGDGSAL